MNQLPNRPYGIKKEQEDEALSCETGGSVFGCEKRTVGGSPKEAEVGIHSVRDPCLACIEKARQGSLYGYSIRNQYFWINERLWFYHVSRCIGLRPL